MDFAQAVFGKDEEQDRGDDWRWWEEKPAEPVSFGDYIKQKIAAYQNDAAPPSPGKKDLAYAEPYAEPELPKAPTPITPATKPEGVSLEPFTPDKFKPLDPAAPDPKAKADPKDWQDPAPGPRPDRRQDVKGPLSKKLDVTGGTASLSKTTKRPDGSKSQTGVGIDKGGNVNVGTRSAGRERDAEGKVVNGGAASAGVGLDGVNGTLASTKDGKTTALKARVTPKEVAMGVSHGNEQRSGSVQVSQKDGTTAISVGGKSGNAGVKAGYWETNRLKSDAIGSEGIDATIRDFVGRGTYLEHDTGRGGSLGVDVEKGVFGVGASGYIGKEAKLRHFNAAKAGEEPVDLGNPIAVAKAAEALKGIGGVEDIDLSKLAKGEGYSFERSKIKGGEGHVKVGATLSLGVDDAEMSQAVLARDDKGDLRVMIAQGDADTLTGSISVNDAVTLAHKESKAKQASVAFTAHGPEGERAVKTFQQTGLLPGADQVARSGNPKAVKEFEDKKKQWEEAKKRAGGEAGLNAITAMKELEELREAMCKAAGDVNEAFLQRRGHTLDAAGVPGVTYDNHTISTSKASDTSLSALGLSISFGGSKETEWDQNYRADAGKSHLEQGLGHEDSYLFDPTETSSIILDPKGYAKDGDPVAMVMSGKTDTNQRQRDILARRGTQAFDMPAETLEAWRENDMHESKTDTITVAMTEGQLVKLRDKIARADAATLMSMSSSASIFYDHVKKGSKAAPNVMSGDTGDWINDRKLKEELGDLYEKAAESRAKRIEAAGGDTADKFDFWETDGMTETLAALDHVKTGEDFARLTPEEQMLFVTTGAKMRMIHPGGSPFDTMGLALRVKDRDQRNALMRQIFKIDESLAKGADGAVDFIEWVQNRGAAAGLAKAELDELLSGVAVRTDDKDTEGLTTMRDGLERLAPGSGNRLMGKKLALAGDKEQNAIAAMENGFAHSNQSYQEMAADRYTDIIQAVRGNKPNPAAVTEAMRAALAESPDFEEKMWETLAKDPPRYAHMNHMLEGTRFHRGPLPKVT